MDKYSIIIMIVVAVILAGRIIVMNLFFDHTKPHKRKSPTEARFEVNTTDCSGKAITVKKQKDSCLVTISNFSSDKDETESSFVVQNDILNDIEGIVLKYDLPSIKERMDGHNHSGRSFSIDYGDNVRYFIRYYQQLSQEFISMLDEIESVLKSVVPDGVL